MEIVQIIYDILIFGGGLLILVVLLSFVLSRPQKEMRDRQMKINTQIYNNSTPRIIDHKKNTGRVQEAQNNPVVYRIDSSTKEVKFIRKPTHSSKEAQDQVNPDLRKKNGTNGNGKRYTIVNDVMKKSDYHVASM